MSDSEAGGGLSLSGSLSLPSSSIGPAPRPVGSGATKSGGPSDTAGVPRPAGSASLASEPDQLRWEWLSWGLVLSARRGELRSSSSSSSSWCTCRGSGTCISGGTSRSE